MWLSTFKVNASRTTRGLEPLAQLLNTARVPEEHPKLAQDFSPGKAGEHAV
jgi:hypothetical protein